MIRCILSIAVEDDSLELDAVFNSPPMVDDVISLEHVVDGEVVGCGDVRIKERTWFNNNSDDGLQMDELWLFCVPHSEGGGLPFSLL